MAQELIWLHPDWLNAQNPAWIKYPGAPALFVFDAVEMELEAWSLKRIQFLYETLLELPCAIDRGDVARKLLDHCQTIGASRIVTVDSVNPRFSTIVRQLRASVDMEVLPAPTFVDYRGNLDLKRFSRYWKRVEPIVFDK